MIDQETRAYGPVVGYTDHQGRLWCRECAWKMTPKGSLPIRADIFPHNVEPCERCGKPLTFAEEAPRHALRRGHTMVVDPPASGMARRWTCTDCGRSALQAGSGNAYGAALFQDCDER